MTKPRVILTLVGIFLAGAASGVMVHWAVRPAEVRRQATRDILAGTFERISRELELTPEQLPQVERLMREMNEDLARMRQELWRNGAERIQKMNLEVDALLTPAQRVRFEQIRHEQAERMAHRQKERERRYGTRPPHGNPAPSDLPPGAPPPPPPEN